MLNSSCLGVTTFHPIHHFPWIVAVQQPQRPSNEREAQREGVEAQPPVIEIIRSEPCVMWTELQAQEGLLPLNVEVHGAFNVNED